MIKKGDIFHFTSTLGRHGRYYVDEVYEDIFNERMVIFSWKDNDDDWEHTCQSEIHLLTQNKTGQIKFILNKDGRPPHVIKPHTFNPKPIKRFMPWGWDTINPYQNPKLFTW